MELTLVHQTETAINVTCDSQYSHRFDLQTLIPSQEKELSQPIDDPVAYGKAIYLALFPPGTLARHVLETLPECILLITSDNDLDSVPWEYAYGSDGFLVLECYFVRGLPADQRIAPPTLDTELYIVAVPSNPLSHDVEPLNIDGEWMRLKEIIQQVPYAITLERTRPPTIEQVRILVANQRHRVLHFMGHGGQDERGALLYFEQENGDLDPVTARQFALRVRGTAFLVTLNACISATPGATSFSNLAASLVRQTVPYALGMRFSIPDEDARAFSRVFYNDLARGTPVEEALRQARLTLATSSRPWVVGVPVLYTALAQPASGFVSLAGIPQIKERQPRIEVSALPRAEGTFQGHIDELKQLGTTLTGDSRTPLVTIHGGGGQGKTALAREAVERFAYAWPGGVWAISLENLPSRELFVNDLARFLGIDTQKALDPNEIERLVMAHLVHRRTLIVLDNVETLIEAVEAKDKAAISLAELLRQFPSSSVSLLVTSRMPLEWIGEELLELSGLSPRESTDLFLQCVLRRRHEIDVTEAWDLSKKLDGHPLGVRLLASAFDANPASLRDFLKEYDTYLLRAEDKYRQLDHRHRSLYACIDMSVRYLDTTLCSLLSGLWIFHGSFWPITAVAIFDPDAEDTEENPSPIRNYLHILWRRGLLTREEVIVSNETLALYHLLPITRPYIEQHLEQVCDREMLLKRFGKEYLRIAGYVDSKLKSDTTAVTIAQRMREDLDRAVQWLEGVEQGYYLLEWGWILNWLGNSYQAVKLLENALEIAQGHDRQLELQVNIDLADVYHHLGHSRLTLSLLEQVLLFMQETGDRVGEAITLNNLAREYRGIGQVQAALNRYEQALSIMREVGNRAEEVTTLNNLAVLYHGTGQVQHALSIYEQILPFRRELNDREGEATTLNGMAGVYLSTGQTAQALKLLEQALFIVREIGYRSREAATLNNMGGVYEQLGRMQQALGLYEQALLVSQEIGDQVLEASVRDNIGKVYQHFGQLQQALTMHELALSILREVGNREGEAIAINNLAGVYQRMGEIEKALGLYEQALPIMREIGDLKQEAATLNNLALLHQHRGQMKQSQSLYERALSISQEVGDRAGEATTLNNLAGMYQDVGQLQQAQGLYNQSLLITQEVGDRAGEATTLNNLALLHQRDGQLKRALALYEQALSIHREVGDRAGEATVLHNLAEVCRDTDQMERALSLYKRSLPIHQEIGDKVGEATTLNSMAAAYYKIGQIEQALGLYEQALSIHQELDNWTAEANALNNLAVIYRAKGKSQGALKLFEAAISIFQIAGDPASEAATLCNMAMLYHDLDQLHEATTYMKRAIGVLAETGLPHDVSGHTIHDLQNFLRVVSRRGKQPIWRKGILSLLKKKR